MSISPQRRSEEPVYRVQTGQVIESICTACLQTIAYSPDPEKLTIAERAHRCSSCPAFKKKLGKLFVINDRPKER